MHSGNYGDIQDGIDADDFEQLDDALLATTPAGTFLEHDDDSHNHDVGPAPRPPRFGDL